MQAKLFQLIEIESINVTYAKMRPVVSALHGAQRAIHAVWLVREGLKRGAENTCGIICARVAMKAEGHTRISRFHSPEMT